MDGAEASSIYTQQNEDYGVYMSHHSQVDDGLKGELTSSSDRGYKTQGGVAVEDCVPNVVEPRLGEVAGPWKTT